jgi:hypothetical protein
LAGISLHVNLAVGFIYFIMFLVLIVLVLTIPCCCVPSEHDGGKASWIIGKCSYVIVDGHHRFTALKRILEEYGAQVSPQLAPPLV